MTHLPTCTKFLIIFEESWIAVLLFYMIEASFTELWRIYQPTESFLSFFMESWIAVYSSMHYIHDQILLFWIMEHLTCRKFLIISGGILNCCLLLYALQFVFEKEFKCPPTFSKLKTLLLSEWHMEADFRALTYFLLHSPIIEKLTLQMSKVGEYVRSYVIMIAFQVKLAYIADWFL
jgi:hypothetical protein